MERKQFKNSGINQRNRGIDAHLLGLLQILFSTKNGELRQEEILEYLRLTPELLISLLNAVPSTNDHTEKSRLSNKNGEAVAAYSKTNQQSETKERQENKTENPGISHQCSENENGERKKSREDYGRNCKGKRKTAGKRKNNDFAGKAINEGSLPKRRAREDRADVPKSICNKSNALQGQEDDAKDSDDVLLAKRMLDILMYPPSFHHQRSVLAVLKSDDKLRKVFNEEKAKIGNVRIPVFKQPLSRPKAVVSDKPTADQREKNQSSPNDKHAFLRFLEAHFRSLTNRSSTEHNIPVQSSSNQWQSFPEKVASTAKDMDKLSTSFSLPMEKISQQGPVVEVPELLGQFGGKPDTYFIPTQHTTNTSASYPLLLQRNVQTVEPAMQDNLNNYQDLSNEMYMLNNSPCYFGASTNIALPDDNHTSQAQENSTNSYEVSEDSHLAQEEDVMNAFFALLDPNQN